MTKLPVFDDHLGPLDAVIKAARAAGADEADALIGDSRALNYGMRMGKIESCEQSEDSTLGLRVLVRGKDGFQSASVATNDLRALDAQSLAERAVAMARAAPTDPYAGLADASLLATEAFPLDLADPDFALDAVQLQDWCKTMEEAGLSVPGITNSAGANAGASQSRQTLMTSNGFAGSRTSTDCGMSVQLIAAGGDGRMVRDYDYSSAVYLEDLKSPEYIGRRAGERTLRRLGGQKIDTMADIPVIYDARVAKSLLSIFLGAINGSTIALGQSLLVNKLGERVFAEGITILDEPHLPRGPRSRPFDAEGLPTRPRALVENGILNMYMLNLHAARQLKMDPTGHATRGATGAPGISPSNVTLAAGTHSVDTLMSDIKRGLFVTSLSGAGVNTLTGDYSLGVEGILIENGQLTVPVSEVTIASTLQHIFSHLIPASDLVRESGIDSPSIRVDGMTLAGK